MVPVLGEQAAILSALTRPSGTGEAAVSASRSFGQSMLWKPPNSPSRATGAEEVTIVRTFGCGASFRGASGQNSVRRLTCRVSLEAFT